MEDQVHQFNVTMAAGGGGGAAGGTALTRANAIPVQVLVEMEQQYNRITC